MKRLLLLGGGHAHLQVLHALAAQPLPSAEVMLVAPYPDLVYSGMVPGVVAGHYDAAACRIALAPLAAAAHVSLVETAAVGLDAAQRRVRLADGRLAEYDLLSIDTGSVQQRARLPGAREHALFLRPIEHFLTLQQPLLDLADTRVLDLVVVGGGAAGFEVALALHQRLCGQGGERARIALVTGGPPPLAGYPAPVMQRALRALKARRVTVFPEAAAALEPGALVLASGARLACDGAVVATGGDAPPWLQGSGLALCDRGFVRTGPTLQSTSHPEVFAAGDVATRADAPHPRSGVYAVRAGPPLAENLRRAVGGGTLLPYQPPRRTLNLLSCGSREAIAAWGGWSAQGRWVWWWKDRIDRAFVARFRHDTAGAAPAATRAA